MAPAPADKPAVSQSHHRVVTSGGGYRRDSNPSALGELAHDGCYYYLAATPRHDPSRFSQIGQNEQCSLSDSQYLIPTHGVQRLSPTLAPRPCNNTGCCFSAGRSWPSVSPSRWRCASNGWRYPDKDQTISNFAGFPSRTLGTPIPMYWREASQAISHPRPP